MTDQRHIAKHIRGIWATLCVLFVTVVLAGVVGLWELRSEERQRQEAIVEANVQAVQHMCELNNARFAAVGANLSQLIPVDSLENEEGQELYKQLLSLLEPVECTL